MLILPCGEVCPNPTRPIAKSITIVVLRIPLRVPMAAITVLTLMVCRLMATCRTAKRRQVSRYRVTLIASCPFIPMIPRINSEVGRIVIHGIWCPNGRAMTHRAIMRESLTNMILARRSLVIRCVALIAIRVRQLIIPIYVT